MSARSVCSGIAEALTVTVSWIAPTVSRMSTRRTAFDSTAIPFCRYGAKEGASALTS
jgi:hypothetical protein